MDGNFDMGSMDVLVGFDEVCSKDGGEEFWWRDWVLLGHNVGGVLHGVCSDYNAIVCFGIARAMLAIDTKNIGIV